MAPEWMKHQYQRNDGQDGSAPPELPAPTASPEIPWVAPTDNPWNVPVLDVRPLTLHSLSMSKDPRCAANAVSFFQDDGTSFIGVEPPSTQTVAANLRFRVDRVLADGVLFTPQTMEHKWALFYHRGRILCIRSWWREVHAVAAVHAEADHVVIDAIRGTLCRESEPAFTVRVLDYLLRSHALHEVYPAPLPPGMEEQPSDAASWCFSCFGNRALFATPHEFAAPVPERPLRTNSLMHIAVARGDADATRRYINEGLPVDLLASDGLTLLHWALVREDTAMMELLLQHGSPVDVRSDQGATPLMTASQSQSIEKVDFVLEHGADPNAADLRGFTALHRTAEMGKIEFVELLLSHGAAPNPEAQGHTPRSLAQRNNHTAIIELLDGWGRKQ